MKIRIPYKVMVVSITCLALCSASVLSTWAAASNSRASTFHTQGLRGRLAAKSHKEQQEDKSAEQGRDKPDFSSANSSICLYVNDNLDPSAGENAVEAYASNRRTGRLSHVGRFNTGGLGDPFVGGFEQHSIVSTGRYVYAVNPGDNTISAFEVRRDCSLRRIDVEPSRGEKPESLAVSNGLLYVANAGHSPVEPVGPASYAGYRIRQNGKLSPLQGCPVVPAPGGAAGNSLGDVLLNERGDVLVGTGLLPNLVNSFQVDRNGCLVGANTYLGGGGPFGAIFSPANPQQLFIGTAVPELFSGPADRAPGLDSYRVNRRGELTLVDFFKDYFNPADPAGSDEALRDPCWLAMTQDGRYLWTSSFIPAELTLFRVDRMGDVRKVSVWDPSDSIPNPNPGDPLGDLLLGSTDIVQKGDYLYQLRVFDVPSAGERPLVPQIHVLRLTGNWAVNGGLALAQKVNLPADLALAGTMGIALVEP